MGVPPRGDERVVLDHLRAPLDGRVGPAPARRHPRGGHLDVGRPGGPGDAERLLERAHRDLGAVRPHQLAHDPDLVRQLRPGHRTEVGAAGLGEHGADAAAAEGARLRRQQVDERERVLVAGEEVAGPAPVAPDGGSVGAVDLHGELE